MKVFDTIYKYRLYRKWDFVSGVEYTWMIYKTKTFFGIPYSRWFVGFAYSHDAGDPEQRVKEKIREVEEEKLNSRWRYI